MGKTKILILKLGLSETLDSKIGRFPSLGDVIRTTPILLALKVKYPDSNITWVVSEKAEPLLHNNPYIDRILVWDEFLGFQLMQEKFDILINLEKIAGLCALSSMMDAWNKYGFRFDSIDGSYHAYEHGLSFISYLKAKEFSNGKSEHWQKVLIEMLGIKWEEQEYVLNYQPQVPVKYDFGFNWKVGDKWPEKALPLETWKEAEAKLKKLGYTVTWQEGLNNIYDYIDWIYSCRTFITNDSLGLHIAFALKKEIVALFGPTDSSEVFFYGNAEIITAKGDDKLTMMNSISAEDIVEKAVKMVNLQKERAVN